MLDLCQTWKFNQYIITIKFKHYRWVVTLLVNVIAINVYINRYTWNVIHLWAYKFKTLVADQHHLLCSSNHRRWNKSKPSLHYWSINANLIKFEILPSQYYQRATLDYVYDHTLIMQRGKRIDYFYAVLIQNINKD